MANELRTFVLVQGGKVVSPLLVTVRDYAAWMESYYDKYICQLHLYLVKKNGVAEWHPETQIGLFFSPSKVFTNPNLYSWYIHKDSEAMQKLIKHNFAFKVDCRKSKLRVYNVHQIEYYIQNNIDNDFSIASKIMTPQQVVIKSMDGIDGIKPSLRRKLF